MAQRLTDKTVRDLPAPASGNRVYYDSDLPGFGARVTAAGARSFVLNYRHAGRERRMTLGSPPAWTVAAARKQAEELRREIDMGRDPLALRDAERDAPTVVDLAARYLEYAATRKRPRSLQEDKAMLAGVILPALAKHRVTDLRRADVTKLFAEVTKRAPIRANRMLSLLRRMLNLAATEFEMREGPNPATAIERNQETKRDRHLTAEELARLLAAVATHRNQQSANVIRLALLTGARRGELLGCTWDQFDLERGIWVKPASLTKQRRLHTVPLNGPARKLLADLKTAADAENARRGRSGLPAIDHVFPAATGTQPQGDLKRTWASICHAADLKDLRFHDLRHAFASFLASSGHNLPLIGQLLGHSNAATTQRYAHLLLDPQREATERVGNIIANAGRESADVVPLTGGRRA